MLDQIESFLFKLKLRQQVIILLIIMFLLGISLSGIGLYKILSDNAQQQISQEAGIALKTLISVRAYTDTQITPELTSRLQEEFLPQTIPSYAATQVFTMVSKDPNWKNYFYKEAALNPTNPNDKADEFETEIIEGFRKNQNLPIPLTGYTSSSLDGSKLFYVARPLKITEPSCLQCHSIPAKAPATMMTLYPEGGGFGWRLNEIIGTQILYVPATQIFQRVKQQFGLIMGILLLVFGFTIFLINIWLNKFIVKPLKKITQVAEAVSIGETEVEFESDSSQEINKLIEAFNRMKISLLLAMQRLKNKNL
jgi:methyl-accepting chemotaxis protein